MQTKTLDEFGFKDPVGLIGRDRIFLHEWRGGTKMSDEKKQPKAKYRIGTVRITVWENESKDNRWLSYQVENSYFDKAENKFKDTKNFNINQLAALGALIAKAQAETIESDSKKDG